ncbi:hypothetical protein OVA24_13645 [Luteolibacter sp. SL250]|uniref:hypothetical protein n=1 Tax=Luteolibacter sp. SL250 TaxID=2995170 RepID=UPI00226DDECD|nr:hypothetical protein [Luteolibacter sp. SL250]WAC18279.1 hypothetical protein OVA24_13645 [Luteolibacter sp. SL250]
MTLLRSTALGLLLLALSSCGDPQAAAKRAAAEREIAFAKAEVASLELRITSLKDDVATYEKHASRPEEPEYAAVIPEARTKWMDARDELRDAERRRDEVSRTIRQKEAELDFNR